MAHLTFANELSTYGPKAPTARAPSLAEAQAYCKRLATTHYENFTVASWLLPRRLRPHFYAVYAYCRWADDLADEPAANAERMARLDWWQQQLEACYAGSSTHPVFVALSRTIQEFQIPMRPFADLLIAFRQDQRVIRYETHEDVLAYCQNSANPVGALVLYLGRCHDPRRQALSDNVCTGLQLANFCQDVARDWQAGRVYLPQQTLAGAGCNEATFGRCTPEFRQALALEVDRAEAYLNAGRPLVPLVSSELRLDVALFILGGLQILSEIRRAKYDVWARRPTVSRLKKLSLLARAWRMTRGNGLKTNRASRPRCADG